jgi:hypothetical protein
LSVRERKFTGAILADFDAIRDDLDAAKIDGRNSEALTMQ